MRAVTSIHIISRLKAIVACASARVEQHRLVTNPPSFSLMGEATVWRLLICVWVWEILTAVKHFEIKQFSVFSLSALLLYKIIRTQKGHLCIQYLKRP